MSINPIRILVSVSVLIASALAGGAESPPNPFSGERARVAALGNLINAPEVYAAEGFKIEGTLQPLFFEGLPYQGMPTRVFGWVGMPTQREGKVPGVVLVHGGGGTAFKEWVEKWNEHGFAALAIAVEGQTDRRVSNETKSESNPRGWQYHEWAGPARSAIYGDSDAPLEDQWMYHAVAATILANSWLRSLPEVAADQVGLVGISWGGVITSTVMGIDNRFRFAIPIYGCGHLFDADNQYGRALGNNEVYRQVWDPILRLGRATMPVQWLSWPGDVHFPLDCQAECYRATPGPDMVTLIPGMKHGHPAGWNPPDSYAFAESVVRDGEPWGRQLSATVQKGIAQVLFASTKSLDRAELISTSDGGVTGIRQWTESPATLELTEQGWLATAPLPEGTTAWILNATSGALTLTLSSEFQQQP